MTDEDRTVERLKGNNCLVKFKDGEELLLYISNLNSDDEEIREWFSDVEKFINGDPEVEYWPVYGMSMSRDSIKYVRKI